MKKDERKNILLVEDDRNTRNAIARILRKNYNVTIAEDGERAKNILKHNEFDLIITDIKMPGADGKEVMREALKINPNTPCILVTAYGSIDDAVSAMREGAYDYISKPLNIDRLEILVKRTLESTKLKEENTRLKQRLNEKYGLENIIGKSQKMNEVFDLIKQVAPAKATVLLTGESGTGKELVAQAIHSLSKRSGHFVAVHCASLPANLLEAELFGHEKGAFTGATERRKGRFEVADGGTIFLDEIAEIDQSVQVKLLRVLETKTFERIGSSDPIETDSRIIAATNRKLFDLVQENRFREDLFYRLNVLNIEIPPLRERKEDIPLLVDSFVKQFSNENNKKEKGVSEEVLNVFNKYTWPGNIRELRNCIERMVLLSRENELKITDIPINIRQAVSPELVKDIQPANSLNLQENEKKLIVQALNESNGNRKKAAEQLGVSRRTLHRKLNEYGLN